MASLAVVYVSHGLQTACCRRWAGVAACLRCALQGAALLQLRLDVLARAQPLGLPLQLLLLLRARCLAAPCRQRFAELSSCTAWLHKEDAVWASVFSSTLPCGPHAGHCGHMEGRLKEVLRCGTPHKGFIATTSSHHARAHGRQNKPRASYT